MIELEPEMFLKMRADMIAVINHTLAGHRPQCIEEQRVVTCTEIYQDQPHAVFPQQWPAWRDHVAPVIADALLKRMMPVSDKTQ